MISSDAPGIVALFAQVNAPFGRLLIANKTWSVTSITPTSDPDLNTVAEIVVDRAFDEDGDPVVVPDGQERYFNRSVEFHRFNIADVVKLQLSVDGAVAIDGFEDSLTDQELVTDQVIDGFTAASFTNDDIYVTPTTVAGTYVITAKPNSLGYYGRVQIEIADAEPAP